MPYTVYFNFGTATDSGSGGVFVFAPDSETPEAEVDGNNVTALSTFNGVDNKFYDLGTQPGSDLHKYGVDDQGISFVAGGVSYNIRAPEGQIADATVLTTSASPTVQQKILSFDAEGFGGNLCIVTQTLIRTDRGDTVVEDLVVGDRVLTISGAHRPIRWIGHRAIDCTDLPNPESAWPICIAANAFGMGVPSRDLRVSPDHCLFFDDVLIPAKHLVNGATIRQEAVTSVDYWHIELDSHEILLAEGTPIESYRDCGMHAFFKKGESWGRRSPDAFSTSLYAPHVLSGPRLHAVKEWLIARAKHLGACRVDDPSLSVVADGRVLSPSSAENRRFAHDVPEGTRELVLRSRSSVPAHWIADNEDHRALGVRVSDVVMDGTPIAMTDERLAKGWHAAEPNGRERWTTGKASLPHCRRLSFTADWFLGYPVPDLPEAPPADTPVAASSVKVATVRSTEPVRLRESPRRQTACSTS